MNLGSQLFLQKDTLNKARANGKWFGLVAAFNKPSTFSDANIDTNLIVLYKQEAGTNQIYLIDVVFSTTLLFERPVLAKSEGSTFDLTKNGWSDTFAQKQIEPCAEYLFDGNVQRSDIQ